MDDRVVRAVEHGTAEIFRAHGQASMIHYLALTPAAAC
jgi:hypothetical protein